MMGIAQTLIAFCGVTGFMAIMGLLIAVAVHLRNIDYAITKMKNRGEEL